ncbi:MAG: BadF/BadG/BcrA/BcrD ATPase family protein [Marinosulfonomonas sp.]
MKETCSDGLIMVIDGGGSTCRARLVQPDGVVVGHAVGGPANAASAPILAHANIVETIKTTYENAGLRQKPQDHLFLALAGVSAAGGFLDGLQDAVSFSSATLVSDLDAGVCAALGPQDGVAVNVGTGSYFVAQKAGKQRRIGGRGYLISDECSGAWLGLNLLRELVKVHDGLATASPLTKDALSRCGGSIGSVSEFSFKARPQDFAAFAPLIVNALRDGDTVAKNLFDRAVNEMCRNLEALDACALGRLVLVGGLAETYQPLLPTKYQNICALPYGDTLDGAVVLALQATKRISA